MLLKQITAARNGTSFDVDIVTVHGSFEDDAATWTDPESQWCWLHDVSLEGKLRARVLSYAYDVESWDSIDQETAKSILNQSVKLIAFLHADRSSCDALQRPLIFVCHGIGGIIVKRALSYSNTSTSRQVRHRRSIYVSTYAVLFFGTPHHGFNIPVDANGLHRADRLNQSSLYRAIPVFGKRSGVLQEIEDQFAPLVKRFSIYCFWEELRSRLGNTTGYVVDRDSAVPMWLSIEQMGLHADHSHLCKFSSNKDSGFRIVVVALKRYTEHAAKVIPERWSEDLTLLRSETEAEITEIRRDALAFETRRRVGRPTVVNEHFLTPRRANMKFTGRADSTRMVERKFFSSTWQSDIDQHKIFVLFGLGGSGKTEFCLKFAQDHKNRFWGVFWVDATTNETAEAAYANFGSLAKKDSTFEAGRHWLASCDKPWLLIIDNADDPAMEVSKYIPAGNSGYVLITTQNHHNVSYATVGDEEIREMEPDDAVSLLLRTAGSDDPSDKEQRNIAFPIARTLGYLALALVHAGSTIHRNICTLGEYLSEYTKHRPKMMLPDSASAADKSKKTIITTWEVSYQRIANWTTVEAKDAICILHIFGFLHNENIPESLFEKSWRESQVRARSGTSQSSQASYLELCTTLLLRQRTTPSPHLQTPEFLEQPGQQWDKLRFHQALALLSDLSLIYWDAKRALCYMHPVIHAWARDRLAIESQQAWLEVTSGILADSISPSLEASGRAHRRLLLNHIDTCLGVKNALVDRLVDDTKDRGSRSLRFASVYAECGRYRSALQIQRHIAALRKKTLGTYHTDTLEAMHDLSITCWNAWMPLEAFEVQKEILRARTRKWRAPTIEALKAMDDLARTYWLSGNRRDSERLGSLAVLGLTKSLGPEDPDTLKAMHNLGVASLHLGQNEKAVELLEHVYRARKLFWGLQHDDTLATMNELSMALVGLGREHYAQAEDLCRQALAKRMSLLGDEHAYTLWSVNNLSKVCCARAHWEEAVEMLEHIIPTVIRTLGNAHVGMSMTKYNLACAYAGQTKWSKAESILRQQLEYVTPSHPDWIAYMSQLARICEHGGQQLEAQKICVRAIKQYGNERALHSKTPHIINIVERFHRICRERGQMEVEEDLLAHL